MKFYVRQAQFDEQPEIYHRGKFPKTKASALAESIAKWRVVAQAIQVLDQPVENGGINECALCKLYYMEDCIRCPVFESPGKDHSRCRDTPCNTYEKNIGRMTSARALKLAQAEVKFLEGLQGAK